MTDLTEKWKNGELEDGMYYMENTSGIIGRVGHSKAFPCYNVKQILAPVPSYDEWWKLKAENDFLDTECRKWSVRETSSIIECFKLKELIKECREWIEYLEEIMLETENTVGADYFQRLSTRIDEALK